MMQFCEHFSHLVCVTIGMVMILEARPAVNNKTTASTLNSSEIYYESNPAETKKVFTRNATIPSTNSSSKTRILTHPIRVTYQTTDEENNDQDIIFPDSLEALDSFSKLHDIPKCAKDTTFCEEIETYPYFHVKEVLLKRKSNIDLFATDEAVDEIANRIGDPEDYFICPSYDQTIFPKVGKNTKNQWRYIINQGDKEGYIQGVRVETCKSPNTPCDLIGSLPNGYITSCKQKYVYRRMMAISEGGEPIPDTFLMPSACCCSYKRDTQFLENFGSKSSGR